MRTEVGLQAQVAGASGSWKGKEADLPLGFWKEPGLETP